MNYGFSIFVVELYYLYDVKISYVEIILFLFNIFGINCYKWIKFIFYDLLIESFIFFISFFFIMNGYCI